MRNWLDAQMSTKSAATASKESLSDAKPKPTIKLTSEGAELSKELQVDDSEKKKGASTNASLSKGIPSITLSPAEIKKAKPVDAAKGSSVRPQRVPNLGSNPATVKPVTKKRAPATCEVGVQTEFSDEREILLSLLRRSPELLKLVRVVKGTN